MHAGHGNGMKMLLAIGLAAAAPALAVPDQRRGDQQWAYEARREGRILPLKEIEARTVPTMKGAQYIGSEVDSGTGIYTLKFLRDGMVIWVEVDGRTGQILGRTGR